MARLRQKTKRVSDCCVAGFCFFSPGPDPSGWWVCAHPFTLCVAAGSGAAASGGRNLWVSGLSSTTRATDLKTLFSKYGKVGKYGD